MLLLLCCLIENLGQDSSGNHIIKALSPNPIQPFHITATSESLQLLDVPMYATSPGMLLHTAVIIITVCIVLYITYTPWIVHYIKHCCHLLYYMPLVIVLQSYGCSYLILYKGSLLYNSLHTIYIIIKVYKYLRWISSNDGALLYACVRETYNFCI